MPPRRGAGPPAARGGLRRPAVGGGGFGWAAARRPAVACVVRQPVPERGEGVEAKGRERKGRAGRGDAPWRSRAQPPRHGGLAADG